MNYRNSQLLDELAAQYVVGTLRGPARTRFERLCRQIPQATQALHRWEDRLVNLAKDIEPVKPPAIVWQKIQARLGHTREEEPRGFMANFLSWWRRPELVLASIAVVALSLSLVSYVTRQDVSTIGIFADTTNQTSELWRVEATKDREELVVTRATTQALDPTKDYELWALPDSGAAPVSLGLMPKSGKRSLSLSDKQRLALAGASKIAISLESLGGSTTGAPGTVLFVTNVTRAS
jgi:anti-sigma-K factor RskA